MNLRRVDGRTIPEKAGECRAFLVCRNEVARLPYALSHHRDLGVARFLVVDNGSNDGSLEFLLEQPDCYVFHTTDSFAQSQYGVAWINALLDGYGAESWNLLFDADELFVYPHSETVSLPELCRHLERRGKQGILTLMLDMYNAGPIARADYIAGTPFLETCPWFDVQYEFRSRLPMLPLAWPFPGVEAVGGPRLRRFYPRFTDRGRLTYEMAKAMRRFRRSSLGGSLDLRRFGWNDAVPPRLTKVPLLNGASGARYVDSHRPGAIALARETGVLLHFKYFSDFHHRVQDAIATGQHFDGSSEYALYHAALLESPALSFHHEGSGYYAGTDQLVELGLMRSSRELDAVAQTAAISAKAASPGPTACAAISG